MRGQSSLRHHPEIDAIVIHEGEATLVEIADSAGAQLVLAHIPGIGIATASGVLHYFTPYYKLDMLPFPDRRGPIHLIAGVPTSYMMGSRAATAAVRTVASPRCTALRQASAPPAQCRANRRRNGCARYDRGTRQFIFQLQFPRFLPRR